MVRLLILVSIMLFFISGLLIAHTLPAAATQGRNLPIPNNVFTPFNQAPVSSLSRSQIATGLELPKNLIISPSCSSTGGGGSGVGGSGGGCQPIVGTNGPDIIVATAVTSASIYGLDGNDIMQCGPGNCKIYGGEGDNTLISGSSTTAQLYGGSGNNIFVGGTGDTLMVGGKGNDQLYAGSGNDMLVGGGGSNYFDCGPNGNGVILDFNAKNGDTKAGNCKYVITVKTGVPPLP
jgi:hypothetical protein